MAFGLTYKYVQPGQLILDIGISTGLGSILFQKAGLEVFGLDFSQEILEVCRSKGFTDLQRYDLNKPPYPYASESMDHAVCAGVQNFFSDLSPVFEETTRILRKGGLFVFIVGDSIEGETHEREVEPELAKSDRSVMIYQHSPKQIDTWLERYGFELLRSLSFTVFMDRERTRRMPFKTYLARKAMSIG